ncbi:MAG: hypothetical protein M3R24_24555 [Chloroflexota bacterium]|nr:hypothetical protein [Chloroflexota bacterium]
MSAAMLLLGFSLIALLWIGWSYVAGGFVRQYLAPTCSPAVRRKLRSPRSNKLWY